MRRAPAFFGLAFAALVVSSSWAGAGPSRAFGAEPGAAAGSRKPEGTQGKASSAVKTKTKADPKAKAAERAEVTLQGELTCAKCGLRESSTCQSVLLVKPGAESDGKDVKYYLARNAVADAQHEKVCGRSTPVTITGVVTEEGGRKVLTASTVMPR
ncbi:MAG TPA: hypothetical protein VIU64_22115 [Polyangia bacterium]